MELPRPTRAKWEHHEQKALAVIPVVLLVVSVAIASVTDAHHPDTLHADLALGAAGLAISLLLLRFRMPSGDLRAVRPVVFALFIGVAGGMVAVDPVFGFYAWTGYLQTYSVLRGRWRFAGIPVTALVVASSQVGGFPFHGTAGWEVYALVVVLNAGVAGAITWFAYLDNEESDRRGVLVEELTEANRRLSESLEENAALHQQLVRQAREAGVADERRRMAREIHDTLAQGLAGIVTQLQATSSGDHHLDAALDLARTSLAEARRSVQALRPEALEQGRLGDALTDEAARWTERQTGTSASVAVTGTPRSLPAEMEVTLLRAGQEALANVARHASASRVTITLSYLDDVVTLDVVDDGVGFDPARRRDPDRCPRPPDGSGFGLTAMEQRVAAHDGSLAVESEPGEGTAISVSLPCVTTGPAVTPA